MRPIDRFHALQREIFGLQAAKNLLDWDQEVMMPKAGAEARSRAGASLAAVIHEKIVSPDYGSALSKARDDAEAGRLAGHEAAGVRKAWKLYEREIRLSSDFVRELAELTSAGQGLWAEARKASDFAKFQPMLERIVAMKRQQAELLGYEGSSYDALMDEFEPGARTAEMRVVLSELRDFLMPFVARIASSGQTVEACRIPARRYVQERICRRVAEALGFDFEAGRLDVSTHPFTNRFHQGDTRITTRYDEDDLFESLTGTTHETGHGLYEQGLPEAWQGLTVGEAISMGIHESQSRLWENVVGRSKGFCHWLALALQEERHEFDPPERLYEGLNIVRPSYIRVEADEVTYNLHVCLRFEIELALIEGRLETADLPEAWNAKVKQYLGLEAPDDARGVLQDIHWSLGYFGYFPTYALGNLYALQFYSAAERELPGLQTSFGTGEFRPLRDWLRTNIHQLGSSLTADELVRKVTGEPLSARHFTDYLERKYVDLYRL